MRYRMACSTCAAILAAVVSLPARQAPPRQAPPPANATTCSLNAAALAKFREFALTGVKVHPVPADLAVVFGLRMRAQEISARQVYSDRPEGKYFISFSLENPEDVIFLVQVPGMTTAYLTDTTLSLRAVANGTLHAGVVSWQLGAWRSAQPAFQAVLGVWGGLAARDPKLGGNPNATGC